VSDRATSLFIGAGGTASKSLHEDHALHLALDRMGAYQLELLPMVSRANVHQLQDILTQKAGYLSRTSSNRRDVAALWLLFGKRESSS
jgi:hypothetical protein